MDNNSKKLFKIGNTKSIAYLFIGLLLVASVIVLVDLYRDKAIVKLTPSQQNKIVNLNIDLIERPPSNLNFDTKTILSYPNEFIYAYVNLPLDYTYGSNSIPLALAALISPPGDFLELGMGLFSTPLLHKIAHQQKRHLYSVDTDLDWMNKFIIYNVTLEHKMYHLKSKDDISKYGLEKNWSLVLIDHIYGSLRAFNAIAFAQNAQIVVVHDSEKTGEAGYMFGKNNMTGHFKYVCKFSLFSKRQKTYVSTTLMSNFIDLEAILTPAFQKVKTDYGHIPCDSSL